MNDTAPQPIMSTGRTAWRLVRYRTGLFLGTILFRGTDDIVPFATGLLMKAFFDVLTGDAEAGLTAWTLIALFIVLEVGDRGVLFFASIISVRWRFNVYSLLRTNLLKSVLALRNPSRVSSSSGETTNRFRDDAEGVVSYLEQYIHLWGNLIFAGLAIYWMAGIDGTITAITVVPAILIITIVDIARKHIVRFRVAQRIATEQSTNFANEMFQSVLALQVATAEDTAVGRYERLNDARRKSTLVDNLFNQVLGSVNVNIGQLATGAILVLVAERMHRGEFTVGDFVLFTTYVPEVARSGSLIGRVMAQHRRAEVSLGRMSKMIESDTPAPLVEHGPVYLRQEPPVIQPPPPAAEHRLQSVETRGLSCIFPDSTNGVYDIDLRLDSGSFTVVTGRIGSGKTTLVRALLGALPLDSGQILWNGEPVADPKSFFVPPRSAYTPQVPRLFS
ncbi:MAG: ABC transporter ATP-binding protein, partial [bacterium]|nr:ABC transporter ATP-binding protein [bacterium]